MKRVDFPFSVKHPFEAQQLLYDLDYVCGESMKSAKMVWETGAAHCLEAVHFVAAILEQSHFPPLALSLDSADNICHVVFVFKGRNGWGSLGRSRELGLHGRAPIFRSVRDLAWSYFDPYVDDTGRLTGYALLNLNEVKGDWRNSTKNVWSSEKYILSRPHTKIESSEKRFHRAFEAYRRGGHTPRDWWW